MISIRVTEFLRVANTSIVENIYTLGLLHATYHAVFEGLLFTRYPCAGCKSSAG